ncbi:MAG: hypothetical protein K0R08_847, partial [Solimicrobium sp.]|nr:hypothetical protein [Solimicrobium sp.]
RGYETRSLRKQREAYTMMLEAQQSDESVFSGVPKDIIKHIASLRFKATLAQPELDKKI